MRSWSTSDNFSCKVVYDFPSKQYVGVTSKHFIRFWDLETKEINSIKRIKVTKDIHDLVGIRTGQKKHTMVIYEDGTCESLESALELRPKDKTNTKNVFRMSSAQMTNNVLSYVKEIDQEKILCYTTIDETTLKPRVVKQFKISRYGQDVRLMSFTVIQNKQANADPFFLSLWSDGRLFKQQLSSDDENSTIGNLLTVLDFIDSSKRLSLVPLSDEMIAIYAGRTDEDGSMVVLYNIKFKVVQSKVPFKIYIDHVKLWAQRKHIYLAMGEQVSVIPYRILAGQLSCMIGSQKDDTFATVEREMLNEDCYCESQLEFDDDQTEVKGLQLKMDDFQKRQLPLSKAKSSVCAEEVKILLNEICQEDLGIELTRTDILMPGEIIVKLTSNIDESSPFLPEHFELLSGELEKYGCSEVEVTNRVVPILIKANLTEAIGLLLKKYNHISEKVLVDVIIYLLSCDVEDVKKNSDAQEEPKKLFFYKEKKVQNSNLLLSTRQILNRDVLSIAMCCSFDAKEIVRFLRSNIPLTSAVQLMDHLFNVLSLNSLDDSYDMRGNLTEGSDFDMDSKLFEWLQLLLDSHYQQILLSHDRELLAKLEQWIQLVNDHIRILSEMSSLRHTLAKLASNKKINLAKKCNTWYTIEKINLYDM